MNEKKKWVKEAEPASALIICQANSIPELESKYPVGSILMKQSTSNDVSDYWFKITQIDDLGVYGTLFQIIPPHIKKIDYSAITYTTKKELTEDEHAHQRVLPLHIPYPVS